VQYTQQRKYILGLSYHNIQQAVTNAATQQHIMVITHAATVTAELILLNVTQQYSHNNTNSTACFHQSSKSIHGTSLQQQIPYTYYK